MPQYLELQIDGVTSAQFDGIRKVFDDAYISEGVDGCSTIGHVVADSRIRGGAVGTDLIGFRAELISKLSSRLGRSLSVNIIHARSNDMPADVRSRRKSLE